MSNPLENLPPEEQEWVTAELREILSEQDQSAAVEMRKKLAAKIREQYPQIADWILESGPSDAGSDVPLTEKLPVDAKLAAPLKGKIVLIKYGGNAMVDDNAKQRVIDDICTLRSLDIVPVVVHGGGPAISELLKEVGVKTPFIGGHRKTDRSTMEYVEMVLSGKVNSEIVKLIGFHGFKSCGISGKDGTLVIAQKRIHKVRKGKSIRRSDLGQVGDVKKVNPDLVHTLLNSGYIPVIAPIGVGEDLEDYNINADMFAGHMAAALNAHAYIVLTDVDGIFLDKDSPETIIPEFTDHAAQDEIGRIIQGGMIPKVESCLIALEGGVREAHIVNGMKGHSILESLMGDEQKGTTIRRSNDK